LDCWIQIDWIEFAAVFAHRKNGSGQQCFSCVYRASLVELRTKRVSPKKGRGFWGSNMIQSSPCTQSGNDYESHGS
jgi:hypothetical protein